MDGFDIYDIWNPETGRLNRKYRCSHPMCKKVYTKVARMKKHAKSHLVYKPYICQFCHMGFSQKGNIQRHMGNIHNEHLLDSEFKDFLRINQLDSKMFKVHYDYSRQCQTAILQMRAHVAVDYGNQVEDTQDEMMVEEEPVQDHPVLGVKLFDVQKPNKVEFNQLME